MNSKHILSILLVFIACQFRSQSVRDSSFNIPLVGIHFSGDIPKGDLAKRFGNNFSAGGNFLYKFKKNFVVGAECSYFFSKNVKEDVLAQMRTSEGFVIDNEGYPADLRMTERGWNAYIVVGKIFPKIGGHNPNCGLIAWVGGGYMQHKIKLYDANKKVAAVNGNLKKGYDRLSGGPALTQFLGYMYLSNNRLTNFYVGIECFEGFTQSFRVYNYDTGLKDTKKRLDLQFGIRVGWILPLYKRLPKEFYYN
ncbi:MAG: hypothetical protein JST26_00440 [Bacteroidetes bacterium]|nr:hypothetical protein [Bacteroidota bacterium]